MEVQLSSQPYSPERIRDATHRSPVTRKCYTYFTFCSTTPQPWLLTGRCLTLVTLFLLQQPLHEVTACHSTIHGYGTPHGSLEHALHNAHFIRRTSQQQNRVSLVSWSSHIQETSTIPCPLHLLIAYSIWPNPTDNSYTELLFSLHPSLLFMLTLYLQVHRRTAGKGREGRNTLQSVGFQTLHLPSFF